MVVGVVDCFLATVVEVVVAVGLFAGAVVDPVGVASATVRPKANPDALSPTQQIASWATIRRVLNMSLLLVVDTLPTLDTPERGNKSSPYCNVATDCKLFVTKLQ